ncbi:MAG: TraR/DksA family transcriptional regulator [Nitrospiraceae bacterium]
MKAFSKPKKIRAATALAYLQNRENGLRERLLSQRQALVRQLRTELERRWSRPAQRDVGIDLAEEVGISLEEEIGLTAASQRTEVIKQIDRTLDRLEEGRGGICEDCGGEIGKGRLRVMPFATRCTHCQERWEIASALSGNGTLLPAMKAG